MANPEDLGRYRLKRLLGRGALGEVWEASDLEQHGCKVAVKIMHAADDELAMARSHFAREARLASLMRHPNVVTVHDAGEAAGTSFMVMEMVEGKRLRSFIGDTSIETAEKLRWLRQIGDGLSAMHRAGIVHRDLKPENVIVREDRTTCLVDLGIAKWVKFDLGGLRLDEADEIVTTPLDDEEPHSTPEYVPPETTEHELYDELGDQFAWGVLAYELLTGHPPTTDSPPLTTRDDIPHATAEAMDRARAPARDDRWEAMELLLDEIVDRSASVVPEEPVVAGAPSRGSAPRAESEELAPPSEVAPTLGAGRRDFSRVIFAVLAVAILLIAVLIALR